MHEHCPLTPKATARLVKEVLGRMSKYRRELQVFSRFIDRWGALPFDDIRALDPFRLEERELPPASQEEEEEDPAEIVAEVHLSATEMGGESPMPTMEESDGE